jgi:hypothetical protein
MQVVRKYANETLLTDITEVSIIEAWFAEEEAHPCTYPSMFTCPT